MGKQKDRPPKRARPKFTNPLTRRGQVGQLPSLKDDVASLPFERGEISGTWPTPVPKFLRISHAVGGAHS